MRGNLGNDSLSPRINLNNTMQSPFKHPRLNPETIQSPTNAMLSPRDRIYKQVAIVNNMPLGVNENMI